MASPRNAFAPLALLALLGCGGQGTVDHPAFLRFFDAFNDASNVRLTVGGHLYSAGSVGPSIVDGDNVAYGKVPSGSVDLVVKTYDGATTLATQTAYTLAEGGNYTAVGVISGSAKQIVVFRDANVSATGTAVFRVIDGYTTSTPVTLTLYRNSTNLPVTLGLGTSLSLGVGGSTGYQNVTEASMAGGAYTLHVADSAGNEIGTKTVTLASGSPVTLFLYNKPSDTTLSIKSAVDQTAD